MICPHEEVMPPQVWAPVMHGLHQADQLVFIGGELEVAAKGWPKKARDLVSWWRTTPNPVPEASQSTTNALSKSGI
jgi:hypothetical protein